MPPAVDHPRREHTMPEEPLPPVPVEVPIDHYSVGLGAST
jgi:hypothetical protein